MASSSLALFLTLSLLLLLFVDIASSSCSTCLGPNTGPLLGPNTPLLGPNTPLLGPSPNLPQPGPSRPGGRRNCPADALKLGVCANVLGLINLNIGAPPRLPCCALLGNLVDLEAAVCLCTAIRANVLGINLNVPVALSLVLNYCGVGVPRGFQCA